MADPNASAPSPAGIGLGLRLPFLDELLAERPPEVAWLEVHPENHLQRGGRYRAALDAVRESWPLICHGLSLTFGQHDPFEADYLSDLCRFCRRLDTPFYSDHLCFGALGNAHLHDLLPLPRTTEARDVAVARIHQTSAALDLPVAIENVSSYGRVPGGDYGGPGECDFLLDVLESADAWLLLDVNNVLVNAHNHGFDPVAFVERMPPDRVVEIHVGGHEPHTRGWRIDTHAAPLDEAVYELLEVALQHVGPVPVLLERDDDFPPFDELLAEVRRLDAVYRSVFPVT